MASIPFFYNGITSINDSTIAPINALCAQAPVAQTSYNYTRGTNTINVVTRTKFFQAATGNYYLAIYVLENGIDGGSGAYLQSGGNIYYKHNHVMRACNVGYIGESIVASSATAGQTIDKTYNIPVTAISNFDSLYVVSVIWKKNGTKYDFVNAYKEIAGTTDVNEQQVNTDNYYIYPNPASDNLTVDVATIDANNITTIEMLSIDGKLAKSTFIQGVSTQINIADLQAGVYFVKFSNNNSVSVKKFIKE